MDELTEQEQWESLKRWVRTNGPQVLVMVAAMLLAWYGWKWWQGRGEAQAEAASAMYQSILASLDNSNRSEAEGLIETLRKEYPDSPYVSAADLVVARVNVEANELDKAAERLERVATSATDELLRPVAQVRLARIQTAMGKYDEALATLGDKPLGAQESARLEARGDVLAAQGDLPAALAAYEEARQVHPGSGREGSSRELLDLKIADVKATVPVDAEQP